jgi:hypothetical protein
MIETTNASTIFRLNGSTTDVHRANGPAIIDHTGGWSWWLFNKRHRYYGSIIEVDDAWFLHDKRVK